MSAGRCKPQKNKHHSESSSDSSDDELHVIRHGHHHKKHHHKKHHHHNHRNYCTDRYFGSKAYKLRCKLGKLQYKCCPCPPKDNSEELKYSGYNYNGSFHKTLLHDTTNGLLVNPAQYVLMRDSILSNDQVSLASIPLAPGSTMKLTNPLSALATPLIGAHPCTFKIDEAPTLSSDAGAADMVELYCHALVRDEPFTDFNPSTITNTNLLTVLNNTHMNAPDVLANLRYYTPVNVPFNGKTLFRGISADEKNGPYVSQLLLLNVPMGATMLEQKYKVLLPRSSGPGIEWGVNSAETISLQNGSMSGFPAPNFDTTRRYIFNGRSLAEADHNDPPFHFFYQAALILSNLGALPNPGLPQYPNQSGFNTGFGGPSVQCAIADVTGLSLKAAWYWKWIVSRKLRPEVFGLWIENIRSGAVSNPNNYDISNVVLNNGILSDILSLFNSHTLPLCYREGSPVHPSYPSGHATLAGAGATILKIFYDTEKPWTSLPGVSTGSLTGGLGGVVEADSTGSTLQSYTAQSYGTDGNGLSIWGEINKLASNISIGRNWAGVHYRSDAIQSMLLGEQVAIKYMEDKLASYVENNLDGTVPQITFRKFDGTFTTIKPTTCKKQCSC
jgi:hypothetical protein